MGEDITTCNRPWGISLFGPTASGKTALGIGLAKTLGGAIINADSRQVYQRMPIITAMPTAEEFSAAPHHLFDFLPPGTPYSAAAYGADASRIAKSLLTDCKKTIFVGGTGFYLEVLDRGLSAIPDVSEDVSREITRQKSENGLAWFYARLTEVDPGLASRTRPTDTYRIQRAYAVYRQTGIPLSHWQKQPKVPALSIPICRVALLPPRHIVYKRIHDRFDKMLAQGVVAEAAALKEQNFALSSQALTSLGLAEFFAHLDGHLTLDEACHRTLLHMRHYAKRQITWLRHRYQPDIVVTAADELDKVLAGLIDWREKRGLE